MYQEIVATVWKVQDVSALDMPGIQHFYHQLNSSPKQHKLLTAGFGLPFLLARHKGKIAGFASLVVDEQGNISYKCYHDELFAYFSENEWKGQVADAFQQQCRLFTDAEQVASGTRKLVAWLNRSLG